MSDNTIELPEGLDVGTARDVLREFGQTDDAQVISESRIDSLENEIKEAKEAFAAVLAEDSPQSADTLSRQDMDALTEPFRDDEGEIDVDTLRQEPETQTGGSPSGDGGDNPGDVSVDNLSLDEKEEIKSVLMPKRNSFENRNMDGRVDALESQIAEKFGADDFEDVEAELEAL